MTGRDFLKKALTQNGKPYVFGAEPLPTDPDPAALDCSELIQWTAYQLGLTVPDGAINQYNWIKGKGLNIPVRKALITTGALMFKHGVGRHAAIYHVGISIGDGKRMFEAKGSKYGVGVFDVGIFADSPAQSENCWNLAGLLPGVDYSGGAGGLGLGLALFALALWL